MSPQIAGAAGAARAAAAKEMESTFQYGEHVSLLLQNAQDTVNLQTLEAKYRDRFEKKIEELKKNPDYQSYLHESATYSDVMKLEMQDDELVKNNPRLESKFSPKLEEYSTGFQKVVNNMYMFKLQQHGLIQHDELIRRKTQELASVEPGSPEYDHIYAGFKADEQEMFNHNLIDSEKIAKNDEKMQGEVQKYRQLNLINNNPTQAIVELNDKKYTDHIPIDMIPVLQERAERKYEAVKKHLEGQMVETQVEKSLSDNKNDPYLALSAFDSDKELIAKMGDNAEKVRERLRGRASDSELVLKHQSSDTAKKIETEMVHDLVNHTDNARKLFFENNGVLSPEDTSKLSGAFRAQDNAKRAQAASDRAVEASLRSASAAERTAALQERKEASQKYFDKLLPDVVSGKTEHVKEIYENVGPGKLNMEDADKLIKAFHNISKDQNSLTDILKIQTKAFALYPNDENKRLEYFHKVYKDTFHDDGKPKEADPKAREKHVDETIAKHEKTAVSNHLDDFKKQFSSDDFSSVDNSKVKAPDGYTYDSSKGYWINPNAPKGQQAWRP